jgi:hypothetical protein
LKPTATREKIPGLKNITLAKAPLEILLVELDSACCHAIFFTCLTPLKPAWRHRRGRPRLVISPILQTVARSLIFRNERSLRRGTTDGQANLGGRWLEATAETV